MFCTATIFLCKWKWLEWLNPFCHLERVPVECEAIVRDFWLSDPGHKSVVHCRVKNEPAQREHTDFGSDSTMFCMAGLSLQRKCIWLKENEWFGSPRFMEMGRCGYGSCGRKAVAINRVEPWTMCKHPVESIVPFGTGGSDSVMSWVGYPVLRLARQNTSAIVMGVIVQVRDDTRAGKRHNGGRHSS